VVIFIIDIFGHENTTSHTNVSFLEHVISSEGVAVDPEKVKAVVEWTRPTSVFKI
jgi:hypothetical protein